MNDKSIPNTPARRTKATQIELENSIRKLCEHSITFNEFLGFKVTFLSNEKIAMEFPMRQELVGHYQHGRLHGGVISSALDAVGGLAVLWASTELHQHENTEQTLQRFAHLGTIDLHVDYLRQGKGTHFCASAQIIKLGRRIASTRMQLDNNEGVLIATGSANYIVS